MVMTLFPSAAGVDVMAEGVNDFSEYVMVTLINVKRPSDAVGAQVITMFPDALPVNVLDETVCPESTPSDVVKFVSPTFTLIVTEPAFAVQQPFNTTDSMTLSESEDVVNVLVTVLSAVADI